MKIALVIWRNNSSAENDFHDPLAAEEDLSLATSLSENHEVHTVFNHKDRATFDVALMRIPDYIDCSQAEQLAWEMWDRGTPFLVSPVERRIGRNKLYCHRLFDEHNIPQPRWSLRPSDIKGETISKPLCGGRSLDVCWHPEPPPEKPGEPLLFQEYRKPLALWRTIASAERVVLAYKKVSQEKIISVSSGAQREILPAPRELEEISCAMARALGGGLWGMDIIETGDGFLALEANMNFGYPIEYADLVAEEITRVLEAKL